jgi:Autographiviridae endonuclease VII
MNCAECGTEFQPRRADNIYCRRWCGVKARARNEVGLAKAGALNCLVCTRTFIQHRRGHLYCSVPCRNKAGNARATQARTVKQCRSCMTYMPRSEFTHERWRCDACLALRATGHRRCSSCGEIRPFAEFNKSRQLDVQSRCRDCCQEHERIRAQDPAEKRRARSSRLMRSFGITADEFDELLSRQGGGCAICGDTPTDENLHVDHDHACCPGDRTCGRCIRGLLCRYCNQALGLLKDSVARAESAASYLRTYSCAIPGTAAVNA